MPVHTRHEKDPSGELQRRRAERCAGELLKALRGVVGSGCAQGSARIGPAATAARVFLGALNVRDWVVSRLAACGARRRHREQLELGGNKTSP